MYIPKPHEETDILVLHQLIKAHPFGTLITLMDGELVANHIPFVLDVERGEYGTLLGHVARANPVWQLFSSTENALVIFQGTDAYITPSWYPSKHAHGKAVPTWNYAVVHAYGLPRVVEDREWLLQQVTQLTEIHEADQVLSWQVSDAPTDFTERLLGAIVGIEIPIAKLLGKWKTSQNRPETDKLGVIAGLLAKGDQSSVQMAEMVKQHTTLLK